ncbi:MAG: type I-E CRISPR-associated protein Cas6/Cse3/CasE [Rhodomicrobium sp.]
MSFAAARNTIPPSGDLGYAFHQVLNETFGAAAPKPFHYFEEPHGQLVAYSPRDASELHELALRQRAETQAWMSASLALGLPSMEARALPASWTPGVRYRYSVRTRPVCRIANHLERGLPRECDVFLRAVSSKPGDSEWIDKQDVYTAWFRGQLPEAAATLMSVHVSRLSRTQVYRKGAPSLEGPDVSFSGILQVGEPAAFQDCLARGTGRHRAFGFGMILLGNA